MELSKRSRIPPCPGIKLEKSLMLFSRLILLKNKSPTWEIKEINKLIKIISKMGMPGNR